MALMTVVKLPLWLMMILLMRVVMNKADEGHSMQAGRENTTIRPIFMPILPKHRVFLKFQAVHLRFIAGIEAAKGPQLAAAVDIRSPIHTKTKATELLVRASQQGTRVYKFKLQEWFCWVSAVVHVPRFSRVWR